MAVGKIELRPLPPGTGVRSRVDVRRALVCALAAACLVASALGVALAVGPGARSWDGLMHDNVLNNAANGVYLGLLGAALVWLRPHNRVSWLILLMAVANAIAIFGEGWGLASYAWPLPGRTALAWLASWVWAPAFACSGTVLPLIYPTGRTTSRFAARLVLAAIVVTGVTSVAIALSDRVYGAALPGHSVGHNPISGGALQGVTTVVTVAGALCLVVLALLAWGHTLVRLRRSTSPEREQLAWLLAAIIPSIVGVFVLPSWGVLLINAAPFALLIGIVRHDLFDIKLVLRSGLVYGLLIGLALGAYLGVVELISLVTPSGPFSSLFAAAAVALAAVPVYRWLTGAVGRLVYGDRPDPVRALGRLADRSDVDGDDLASMVAAVGDSVRSPHVAVRDTEGRTVAEIGRSAGHPAHEVALRQGGRHIGTLSVAWRTPADAFSAGDRRIIDALAAPVATAVHAARLAAEVGESRARVIAVRESERRQLRHDLHDGLGPSLSGVALGIEAALKAGDEQRIREILAVVHGEVTGLVGEVRHLIDDLGPVGLAPGGLVTALRSHAEAATALGEVDVRVEAGPAPLPLLTGPVEVALHRIAAEALTNVLRHARARHAIIRVAGLAAGVRLVVEDDGLGVGDAPAGVGRCSMAERAASVGGTCMITSRPGGGTTLTVTVPIGGVHAT